MTVYCLWFVMNDGGWIITTLSGIYRNEKDAIMAKHEKECDIWGNDEWYEISKEIVL